MVLEMAKTCKNPEITNKTKLCLFVQFRSAKCIVLSTGYRIFTGIFSFNWRYKL